MRRFLAMLLALLFLFPCAACSREKTLTIRYDLESEPRNLDPQTADSTAALTVIYNTFEGLFRLDEAGELQNGAVSTYTLSADGKTYTFTLRDDLFWDYRDADGESQPYAVTAQDFVFAFRRLLRPSTNSPGAQQYFVIRNAEKIHTGALPEEQLGVEAVGSTTLRITLEEPNDSFLNLLALSYAMPCSERFFEETRGRYGLEISTVMGNGPFSLTRWKTGSSLTLSKNTHYYESEKVLPDTVSLQIRKAEDTPLSRITKGAVHAAILSAQDTLSLPAGEYRSEPISNTVWGIALNQREDVLANANIRRAIAMAFDRDTYASILPKGLEVAGQVVPPDVSLYGENYRAAVGEVAGIPLDSEHAYQTLRAGLEELELDTLNGLRLLVNQDADIASTQYFSQVSQVLQRELSIFVSIDECSAEEYQKKLSAGEFDLALCKISAWDNSPWSILSVFSSQNGENYIAYQDDTFDQLLTQAANQPRKSAALSGYRAAEQHLLESGVFLPMYFSTDYFVTDSGKTGIVYQKQNGVVQFRAASNS